MTIPESPATAAMDSKNILIQNVGKWRPDNGNRRQGETSLSDGVVGSSGIPTTPCPLLIGDREVTTRCQFVRLCQASSIVTSNGSSSSCLGIPLYATGAYRPLTSSSLGDERCPSFWVGSPVSTAKK